MDVAARIEAAITPFTGERVGAVAGVLAGGEPTVVAVGSSPRGGLYDIGSITKTFTALLLSVMHDLGEVSTEDPIERWLPAGARPPVARRSITLSDLATHRSGLPRLAPFRIARAMMHRHDPYRDETTESLFTALARTKLEHEPELAFLYSNFGYALLGTLLSRAAGATFEEALRTHVLEPLGLRDTFVWPIDDARKAQGHAHGKPVADWSHPVAGAGGMWSTVDDLLRYLGALNQPGGSPIEGALRRVTAPVADAGDGRRVALAWLTPADGRDARWHNGGTAGFSSMAILEIGAGVAVAGLSNAAPPGDGSGLDAAIGALAKELAGSGGSA